MASTFSSNIMTGSRANAMVQDVKPIEFGDLNPAAIAQTNGIGPLPNVDCDVVYGSQYELITLDRDTHILQRDTRLIYNTLSETVNQGTTQTYYKGRSLSITDFSKMEVTGTRDVHVTSEDHENYDVHREINEPLKYEVSNAKLEHTWFNLDTKGLSLESTAATIELEGLEAKLALFESQNTAIATALKPVQEKIGILEDKIGAFAGKVLATFDAMPSPSILAPFD